MKTKQLIYLLIGLVIIAIIAIFIKGLISSTIPANNSQGNEVGKYCTMEAKLCPDGSYVGRIPPDCEFAMCPTTSNTGGNSTTTPTSAVFNTKIGERTGAMGIAITPVEIVEDSRCAIDVQCIQAGTVRVRSEVTSSESTTTLMVLGLNNPVTVMSKKITLINVLPARKVGVNLSPSDYTLVFEIK